MKAWQCGRRPRPLRVDDVDGGGGAGGGGGGGGGVGVEVEVEFGGHGSRDEASGDRGFHAPRMFLMLGPPVPLKPPLYPPATNITTQHP